MTTAVVAGMLALVGVVLGVLLEPVRAAFARRVQAREQRLRYCISLLEGATRSMPAVTAVNRFHRDEQAGKLVDEQKQREAVDRLIAARQQIRESVLLLRLTGPKVLWESAEVVREHERSLRRSMYSPLPVDNGHPDELPEDILSARAALEQSLSAFADVAREKA